MYYVHKQIVRYREIFKERNRDDRRYRKRKIDNIERQGKTENINKERERKTEISNRDKKRETERKDTELVGYMARIIEKGKKKKSEILLLAKHYQYKIRVN